ncbi:IMPACT family member yigZ [Corynebacterium kutscheri]|uniref:IMPACT family member yigZ n=1 Tax=Corynebacterium kutscheri TaxID=35755 RepID=A0AB38VTC9_9CORY|nr:YigZ family protein [Corynebacterium kutscheri]VEH08812.1 IMPACT family member yigZ [Corynebacterium kutscheri]VEH79941.1 IMPACT family member yigZ [Corynebacterium kutscheri]
MDHWYCRPIADVEFFAELEIKRSKFLCFIRRAETEEQARAFISELKRRYPDARHHCSAYIYHVDGAQAVHRSNDDGEPSGTAGIPMLDMLRGSGYQDIVAVTVRYFGGTKLGAGGLVHAYSESVGSCLAQVKTVERHKKELYIVSFTHADAGRIEADLRAHKVAIVDTQYLERVYFTLAVDPGGKTELAALVASLTRAEPRLVAAGIDWVELS